MKKKEISIIFVLAGLVTGLGVFFGGLPLRFLEPIFCIQVVGVKCLPFKINWTNVFLDFLFWFLVLVAGWWVVKWIVDKV